MGDFDPTGRRRRRVWRWLAMSSASVLLAAACSADSSARSEDFDQPSEGTSEAQGSCDADAPTSNATLPSALGDDASAAATSAAKRAQLRGGGGSR